MKQKKHLAFWFTILSGITLLFIGLNFIFNPLGAEAGYGIKTTTSDFSFHYIKGFRDLFSGIIITLLLLKKEYKSLGYVLLIGTIIPAADFCIVLSNPNFTTGHLYAHAIAIIICIVCGIFYLKNCKRLSAKNHSNS
ncbi:MAG: DUF4267 domain-containing protein [Arachidicoccus sp.]|nr:DUF4267 domain-containing protein [Arachidicoccus sp.]